MVLFSWKPWNRHNNWWKTVGVLIRFTDIIVDFFKNTNFREFSDVVILLFFVSVRIYHSSFFQCYFFNSSILFGRIYLRVSKYQTQLFLRMLFHCLLFLIVWDFPVVWFLWKPWNRHDNWWKTVGKLIGFTDNIVDFFKHYCWFVMAITR